MIRHGSRPALLVLFLCLPLSWSAAQHQAGNVHVYVTFPDDRAVTTQVKVGLISGTSGAQVDQLFTNDNGRGTVFERGPRQLSGFGQRVRHSNYTSDLFEVDARKSTQSVLVRVKPAGATEARPSGEKGRFLPAI